MPSTPTTIRFATLALGAFVALSAASASADPLTPFGGDPSPVTLQDVNPHFDAPENRENEFYSEWWSFVFTLDNGYWAYVQFLVTNMGPGDGKGTVKAEVSLPDGQKFSTNTSLERGKWSYSKDKFELKFGDNSISGPLDALVVKVKNSDFEAEYRLKNIAPPWKPGSRRAQYGTDAARYYQFELLAPVARVEGEIKVAGEDEVQKVGGLIYADHSCASIGMHEQAKRWARLRAINDKSTFVMGHIETPDVYGNAPVQFAVLFVDGKLAFETTKFDFIGSKDLIDPKKAGYSAPQMIELKGEQNGRKFRVGVKATRMTEREDYLESSGAAVAFVLSKFAKPIMYYFDSQYVAEVQQEGQPTIKAGGKGRYYYTVVNP